MSVLPTTPFDKDVFENFMKYEVFRRHIYNYWKNEEFVWKMKGYMSRGNYEFFYKTMQARDGNKTMQSREVNRNGCELNNNKTIQARDGNKNGCEGNDNTAEQTKHKDYEEYKFFELKSFNKETINLIKKYQRRHGHNVVMNMFVECNFDNLMDALTTDPSGCEVLKNIIKYNNEYDSLLSTCPITRHTNNLNDRIWHFMKKHEDIFKLIVPLFESPVDPILHKLLSGQYDIDLGDVEKYVNFGFEKELLLYFKEKEVKEILPLINDWNRKFFLSVILSKCSVFTSELDVVTVSDGLDVVTKSDVSTTFTKLGNLDISVSTSGLDRVTKPDVSTTVTKPSESEILDKTTAFNKSIGNEKQRKLPSPDRIAKVVKDSEMILDFLLANGRKETRLVSLILHEIFKIKSINIYTKLPKNLKFIYACRNGCLDQLGTYDESIDRPCSEDVHSHNRDICNHNENTIRSGMTIQDAAHKYEIKPDENILEILESPDLLENLFRICFVAKDVSKYHFVEYFDDLVDLLNSKMTKEDLNLLVAAESNYCLTEPEGYGQERIEYYLNRVAHEKLLSGSLDVVVNSDGLTGSLYKDNSTNSVHKNISNKVMNKDSVYTITDKADNDKENTETMNFKISYVFGQSLSNKYTLFILFDRIIEILNGPTTAMKTLLLIFIEPSAFQENEILRFINALILLLNATSACVCALSKSSLNKISIESKEIQSILPVLIQAFVGEQYFPMFLQAFRSLVFNNYLCFNSLNLILQLLFQYLSSCTEEILNVLIKLENITKDKYMRVTGPLVFDRLNHFAIKNNFSTEDVLKVSQIYCFYAPFDSYLPIFPYLSNFRISMYLIGLLKARGDPILNTRIIESVIRDSKGEVSPSFIGAACELSEFNDHLDRFIPILRELFVSESQQKRTIGIKAFREVLLKSSEKFAGIKEEIMLYAMRCAVLEDYPARLASLEIIERHLPLLFIMRNDPHFLVRKKAYDLWKAGVSHPNKTLKIIYKDVLDFVRFKCVGTFRESLTGAIAEMATKYSSYLEMYVEDTSLEEEDFMVGAIGGARNSTSIDTSNMTDADKIANKMANKTANEVTNEVNNEVANKIANGIANKVTIATVVEMKEFILAEALHVNKLQSLAISFCLRIDSPLIFNLLYRQEEHRKALSEKMSKERLYGLCAGNSELALNLYRITEDEYLVKYLGQQEMMTLIIETVTGKGTNHSNAGMAQRKVTPGMECILSQVESSRELEEILAGSPSAFIYYYISVSRKDHGLLLKLFMKVFESIKDIDRLVVAENIKYIRYCSYHNVLDLQKVLVLLMEEEDRKSFERAVELITGTSVDQEHIWEVAAYLLRNYLVDTRREVAGVAIRKLYTEPYELGYFRNIIKNLIISNK